MKTSQTSNELIPGTPLPVFSTDLIAHLNRAYPHRCPLSTASDRDIWLYAGKRQLVDTLLDILAQAKEPLDEAVDQQDNLFCSGEDL